MNFKNELNQSYKPQKKLTYEQIKDECRKEAKTSGFTWFVSEKVNKKDMEKLKEEGLDVIFRKNLRAYRISWID